MAVCLFQTGTGKSAHPPDRKQAVDDVRPEARSLREIGQWDVFPNGVTNGTASIGSSNGKSIRLII